MLRDLILGPGEAPVLNDPPLWYLAEVLLNSRRVEFGGNDDDHLRREDSLQASVIKVEEVLEAENDAAVKTSAETVEAVDLPCLSRKMPGLIKRGIYVQERIT